MIIDFNSLQRSSLEFSFQKLRYISESYMVSMTPTSQRNKIVINIQIPLGRNYKLYRCWSSGLLRHVAFWLCANILEEHNVLLMEVVCSSEMLVHIAHGATTQKIHYLYLHTIKTSNPTNYMMFTLKDSMYMIKLGRTTS
jgi:hypothetical protein